MPKTEPNSRYPAKNDPAKNDPAKNDPAKNDPAKNDPAKNDAARRRSAEQSGVAEAPSEPATIELPVGQSAYGIEELRQRVIERLARSAGPVQGRNRAG